MPSEESRRKPFPVDLLVILAVIIGLISATMIAGRRGARRADNNPVATVSARPERTVLPQQVGYREVMSLALEGRAHGLAVDNQGHLFVSSGFTITEFGPDYSRKRTLDLDTAARCLTAVDGRLLLGCGDHVQVLNLDSGETSAWPSLGEQAFITSIAAAGETVMVGDAGNRRFVRCGLDGTVKRAVEGTPRTRIAGGADVPSTYFDVAAAPDGTFWATEAGHFGVVHYDAEGRKLGRFGKGSNAVEDFGGCCNPTHVASGPGGLIVTVEKKPDLVKTYTRDGTFNNVVAGPKAFAQKTFIADVAAASDGTVYVLDPKRKRVRVFEPKDDS